MNFDLRCITERDERVITYLASQGQATAEQLAGMFFSSVTSFYKRCHALKKMGLLEACRAIECARKTPSGVRGFAASMKISMKKVPKMVVYRIPTEVRRDLPFADGPHCDDHLLKHQLLLNDVRRRIEKCLGSGGYMVLTDVELQAEARIGTAQNPLVPDLVFRGQDLDIAIELERSVKTESDLLVRFDQYRDSRYTKVIYFCETEGIRRRVTRMAQLFRRIAVADLMNPERVFYDREFLLLTDFLKGKIV